MENINTIDCPYYLLSRVSLTATSALKKGFSLAGVEDVKPAYLGVLINLWQKDGLKLNELGRMSGLEPSSMTGLIDRMERDGLLHRSAAPNDRRAHHIHLTDKGFDVKEPVLRVVDETLSKIFAGITEKDISMVKEILQKVLINASQWSN